jgi:hypothetical protein
MKVTRLITTAVAVVIVGGTIASATPHLFAAPDKKGGIDPSLSPSVTETPEPTISPSVTPEPTETPEPTDTPSPEPTDSTGGGSNTAPDFSACVGLTGLENAICRHEALLLIHPDNTGLQNSLAHLQANLAKQQSGLHGQGAESHGNSGETHGNSGATHGNSGATHGNSGSHGHSS